MYAIVEIKGFQYKVEKDKFLYVPFLGGQEGDKLSLDKVLMIRKGDDVLFGSPYVDGACVSVKILSSKVRADKVIVFKKIRRKGYRKKQGHRQNFSKILIEQIS